MIETTRHFLFSRRAHYLWLLATIGAAACGDGGATSTTSASTTNETSTGGGGGGGETSAGGTAGQGGATTSSSASGGIGGSGGATVAAVCPPGSETLQLDLAGATPVTVAGVPPADGYSPGFSILEGPVWINGALYLSQISSNGQPPAARILRLWPGAAPTIFLDGAGTNGLAVDGNGDLLGCVHKDGSVSRFDLENPGAAPLPLASETMGARFNSPNDLAIRTDGNIYFSDPDWQSPKPNPQSAERAYRFTPGGEVQNFGEYVQNGGTQLVQKPNGVTLTRDEKTLYLGGTGGLFKFPVATDGTVGTGAVVAAVNGGVDGMAMDCAGNLYVTNGQNVVVLDVNEAVIGSIAAGIQVTNVAFGGDDHKTLYITSLGSEPKLLRVALNVPGYPY